MKEKLHQENMAISNESPKIAKIEAPAELQQENKVPVEKMQQKGDEIKRLDELFQKELSVRFESLDPRARGELELTERKLFMGRFSKYNHRNVMGSLMSETRPSGSFMEQADLDELDSIEKEMRSILNELRNTPETISAPLVREKEKTTEAPPVKQEPKTEETNPFPVTMQRNKNVNELIGEEMKKVLEKYDVIKGGSEEKAIRSYLQARSMKKVGEVLSQRTSKDYPFLLSPLMKFALRINVGIAGLQEKYYGSKLQNAISRKEFLDLKNIWSDDFKKEIEAAVARAKEQPLLTISKDSEQEEESEKETRTRTKETFKPARPNRAAEQKERPLVSAAMTVGKAEKGRTNQDSILEQSNKGVYAVFDGVGGESGGDIASNLAVEILKKESGKLSDRPSVSEAEQFVQDALVKANNAIFGEVEKMGKVMASTAVVAVVCYDKNGNRKLAIGNVGDSRAYLQYKKKLERLTVDDDIIKKYARNDAQAKKLQLILDGLNDISEIGSLPNLTNDEKTWLTMAMDPENRERIMNYLGQKDFRPSLVTVDFPADSKLCLFSDGITSNLSDEEIKNSLSEQKSVQELIAAAVRSNKKPDDTSAILVG